MASEQQKTPTQIAQEYSDAVARQQREMNSREAAVKKEREELEEEKKRMAKVDAKETDVIFLNVGGRPFATTRKTLCIEPDTMLANMFSGRWEDRLVRVGPANDHVFLNFNPDLFAILLDYLRAKELAPPERKVALPPASSVTEHQRAAYQVMLEFLGFLNPTQVQVQNTKFTFADSPNFTISQQGKKAVRTTNNSNQWWHVTTRQMCTPGGGGWRVKVGLSGFSMLGIVRQNFTHAANLHNADGYFFYINSTSAFVRGQQQQLPTGAPFTYGHTAALSLDTGGVLTLRNETTGVTHTIPATVQMTHTYTFAFLGYQGPELEILDAE